MFPYGIFFLRCHYCDHYIPLPHISPLGWYADRSFRTADEVKSRITPGEITKQEIKEIWPVEFACMTCQRLWSYSKEEVHKLEEEDHDYPALAEQLKENVLWQLKIVETAGPPGELDIYIVARHISPEDLVALMVKIVELDGKQFGQTRRIIGSPKAFYFLSSDPPHRTQEI